MLIITVLYLSGAIIIIYRMHMYIAIQIGMHVIAWHCVVMTLRCVWPSFMGRIESDPGSRAKGAG